MPSTPNPYFTEREKLIARLIAHDFTDEEICAQLEISIGILRLHRRNILRKIGARGTAGIVRYAIREGIFDEDGRSDSSNG